MGSALGAQLWARRASSRTDGALGCPRRVARASSARLSASVLSDVAGAVTGWGMATLGQAAVAGCWQRVRDEAVSGRRHPRLGVGAQAAHARRDLEQGPRQGPGTGAVLRAGVQTACGRGGSPWAGPCSVASARARLRLVCHSAADQRRAQDTR